MYPTRYSDAVWRKPTGMEQARLDEGTPPPRRCRLSFRVIIPAQLVVGYNRATMTVLLLFFHHSVVPRSTRKQPSEWNRFSFNFLIKLRFQLASGLAASMLKGRKGAIRKGRGGEFSTADMFKPTLLCKNSERQKDFCLYNLAPPGRQGWKWVLVVYSTTTLKRSNGCQAVIISSVIPSYIIFQEALPTFSSTNPPQNFNLKFVGYFSRKTSLVI